MKDNIRVRFAPSPTGPFHIGGARSALFNWLLAKKMPKGKFIVRVEDTDRKRSTKESEENIKDALKWLGLNWDEGIDVGGDFGPYRQTERLAIYKEYTEQLIKEGKAYYCYCTEEEINREREELKKQNKMPLYGGKCRHLTEEERKELENKGRKPVIRFKTPTDKPVVFTDMVRGNMEFDSMGIGDFVIVKQDGMPVYNYAVVIDDATMKISHVIRAEEHLSNTPRQIVLYEALGFDVPSFGHISLILGKDRSKMSKRHGATSVEQYKNLGYLPDALVNFLALLGWSPNGEQEIFTLEELIKEFSTENLAKNPAVFDIDKLNFINAQYMKKLSDREITNLAIPHLVEKGYITEPIIDETLEMLDKFTKVIRDHLSFGAEYVDFAPLIFDDEFEILDSEEKREILQGENTKGVLAKFVDKLNTLEKENLFNRDNIQNIFKEITKEYKKEGIKLTGKEIYMPLRLVTTGQMHGPDLAGIINVLGYSKTMERINKSSLKM